MRDGFITVACGAPKLRLADCDYNAEQTFTIMRRLSVIAITSPRLNICSNPEIEFTCIVSPFFRDVNTFRAIPSGNYFQIQQGTQARFFRIVHSIIIEIYFKSAVSTPRPARGVPPGAPDGFYRQREEPARGQMRLPSAVRCGKIGSREGASAWIWNGCG